MSFKENINRICLERGTNLTAVVKQVKGSSSFTSSINKGSLPKEDEMVQMAKILNCSTKQCKSEHLVFHKTLFWVCGKYRGGRLIWPTSSCLVNLFFLFL